MDRRHFLSYSAACLYVAGTASQVNGSPLIVPDHPDVITLNPISNSISEDLQQAFSQAYQLWLNDPLKRRPVISIPEGTFYINTIENNHRGNYPFHMPPTYKLIGAGKGNTIIEAGQTRGSQYRFLMMIPQTRLDILAECPTLNAQCVANEVEIQGAAENVEVSGLTLRNFDNAISIRDAKNVYVHDCDFIGSLVAIQLVTGDRFGNLAHRFENCIFDSEGTDTVVGRFGLRFEAPFSAVWTTTETGVPTLAECEALGGDAAHFNAGSQTCTLPDDNELNDYLTGLFGQSFDQDLANRDCVITQCEFRNASYSGVEFAGKLNIKNEITYCSFYNCSGTAIEFDKGASFNTVSHNVISGMRPTTAFAPHIPYIFQAAIQEQEGSYLIDERLKSLITEMGYDDPEHPDFKGDDIFYRAASLPQGNEIINNSFDISRSYWIGQFETDTTRAAYLPDIYPSIKLRKPLDTKIMGNTEFISDLSRAVNYDGSMGHSIVIYPDESLRDLRGGVNIKDNKFYGAMFVVGANGSPYCNKPFVIENNDFGLDPINPRGGLSWNYFNAQQVSLINNRILCARNTSSSVMQKIDIADFKIESNTFTLPTNNSFYVRSINAQGEGERQNQTSINNNTFTGGLAILIYDWTNGINTSESNDKIEFSNNHMIELAGPSKVVAVTLWAKNVEVNSNEFDSFSDKVFQLYSLAENFNHDALNTLILNPSSQNKAYNRNYQNTSGSYVTYSFWHA